MAHVGAEIAALELEVTRQRQRLYGEVHWQGLLNSSAEETLTAMEAFFASATPEDVGVLYLVARGLSDERSGEYLLLANDTDLDRLTVTAIRPQALVEHLPRQLRVLLLVDTLRPPSDAAGARIPRVIQARRGCLPPLEQLQEAPLPPWSLVCAGEEDRLSARASAASRESVGGETDLAFSPFGGLVLDLLSGRRGDQNGDGLLTHLELTSYVMEAAFAESASRLPEVSGEALDGPLFWSPVEGERCNRVDDDGDGSVDEDFDADGDGSASSILCPSAFGSDCDDSDWRIRPGQLDVADFRDNDCDGQRDEDAPDQDGNGIPDVWERRLRFSSRLSQVTAVPGALMAVGALVTYSKLNALKRSTPYDGNDYARYVTLSTQTVGLALAGGVSLGLSGTFGMRYFRVNWRWHERPVKRQAHVD